MSLAVDRLEQANEARFLTGYRLQQPVILTGTMARWPGALLAWDRLAARFADEALLSYRLPPEAPARMSAVKADFYRWSDGEGSHEHLTRWTFGEFLAALARGEPHYCMANATKNTRLRDLLAAEAGEAPCAAMAAEAPGVDRREFFIGSRGAGPGLHHDGAIESLVCQLIGTKRVNLYSPADIANLYPADSWLAPTGHFSAVADSFEVDGARFPRFAQATAHECRLTPGEVLYVPPYWYHDTAPEAASATMTIRHAPPADWWGTQAQRDALASSARDLAERLSALSPTARGVYAELLRRDLAPDAPRGNDG